MSNIYLNFPTCVFVKDNILLNKLNLYKKNILNYFEKNKARKSFSESILTNNSYYNNNDSNFTMDNIFKKTIFKNLIEEINNNCVYFCKKLGFSDKQIVSFSIQNIWANLIKKHDYHAFHTHADCGKALISGVFYIDAPTTAYLKFKNSYSNYTPEYPDIPNELSFSEYRYSCVPGRMILFRSHALHGYDAHLKKTDKISVAFNFGNVDKNK